MKVSKDDIATLRTAIEKIDTLELRDKYARGDYPRSELTKDLNKRYRWDLYWACGVNLDGYLDAHIDTALRSVVPAI